MPATSVPNMPSNLMLCPTPIIWNLEDYELSLGGTGFIRKTNQQNDTYLSNLLELSTVKNELDETKIQLPNSKKFVRYVQKFIKEFSEAKDNLQNITLEDAKQKLEESLSELIVFNFDAFSLEVTSDATIFYSLKKDNLSFYIDHYLDLNEESEEMILTIFEGDEVVTNIAGSIPEIIHSLDNNFKVDKIRNFELAVNELPC